MPLNKFATLALLSLLAGCSAVASAVAPKVSTEAAALRSGGYVLDTDHASLIFKIDHLGYSLYLGRFNRFEASLDFDADNPAAAKIEAIIHMNSLDVANDDFGETLMGAGWFDSEQFPQAIFRSTGIEIIGDNKGRLTGDLTLHGVTNNIVLDVSFNGGARDALRGGYVVGFSAKGSFARAAFGVDKFNGIVGDQVAIEIEAEFKQQ